MIVKGVFGEWRPRMEENRHHRWESNIFFLKHGKQMEAGYWLVGYRKPRFRGYSGGCCQGSCWPRKPERLGIWRLQFGRGRRLAQMLSRWGIDSKSARLRVPHLLLLRSTEYLKARACIPADLLLVFRAHWMGKSQRLGGRRPSRGWHK